MRDKSDIGDGVGWISRLQLEHGKTIMDPRS